jgi:hypothetical protein
VTLDFTPDAIRAVARIAAQVNESGRKHRRAALADGDGAAAGGVSFEAEDRSLGFRSEFDESGTVRLVLRCLRCRYVRERIGRGKLAKDTESVEVSGSGRAMQETG